MATQILVCQSVRKGYDLGMSATAAKIVDEFKKLDPIEQRWVCQEILRVVPKSGCGSLTDEELTAIADQTFVLMDKEEDDARPR